MSEITTQQYPPLAYRIKDFCQATGISVHTYYVLKEQGDAPAVTVVGGRHVITHPAAVRWLEQHEDKAA